MTREELFGVQLNEQPDKDKKTTHRYYHIPYFEAKLTDAFNPGEEVWVEEKIDGTNISAYIDTETNEFRAFGRNFELSEKFTTRGAYGWLKNLEYKIRENIGSGTILYFEWLVPHHVDYKDENYNIGYLISARDLNTGKYIHQSEVYKIADKIGVKHAPTIYHGNWKSWDHIREIIGTSELGAHTGEGVVIKAYDSKKGQKMVKVVTSEFKEKMCYDTAKRDAKIQSEQDKRELAAQIVTPARIRKQLYKLIDEGVISNPDIESWSNEDKIVATKNIGRLVYDDCVAEETEFVKNFGKDFGRYSFTLSKNFIMGLGADKA